MRQSHCATRSLASMRSRLRPSIRLHARALPGHSKQGFFSFSKKPQTSKSSRSTLPLTVVSGGLLTWLLYPSDKSNQLSDKRGNRPSLQSRVQHQEDLGRYDETEASSAWTNFARRFETISIITDLEWLALSEKFVDFFTPEWPKLIPGYLRKLQRELSMSPGSLADEIWSEAHDPLINPEIRYSAKVRVSNDICNEEKEYLARRKRVTKVALARYLGIDEKDIHPEDVPVIAMSGSGGGLRALIAGTGSLLATEEDGLFDCVTYTSGVSGSCWLQAFYLSSFTKGRIANLVDHLKARAGIHIAYPPVAFQSFVSLPTSKYLLSGMVEKLKGDAKADFGLVDIYGMLLAARYLIPKGDLGVNEKDFKLSSQTEMVKYGQNPLPIYTAVRHEIPELGGPGGSDSDQIKERAKKEAWFQWFEITPYEFFCEELGAGIPTWAMGRRFDNGRDVPLEHGFHMPEIRMPLLLGIFGSAFCATLNHYYNEVKPLVRSMAGLGSVDEMISEKSDDLSKVHPIDPASIPNYAYGMDGKLATTTPTTMYKNPYIELMDAGMSNNLPIYPLLRPGREVDIVVAFDASADVKTDNWLSVADGYARQRGVKGWPIGIGWPKKGESSHQAAKELEGAQAATTTEAEKRVQAAKAEQSHLREEARGKGETFKNEEDKTKFEQGNEEAGDLGYCTVWVGTTEERTSKPPPVSKAIAFPDTWKLMEPDAGITVVYLPFLANDKVPDVSPGSSDFLSTWNFVYTPEQIDGVVRLARANYDEGKEQIWKTVKAVYERKKKLREEAESRFRQERVRKMVKREGDHFN